MSSGKRKINKTYSNLKAGEATAGVTRNEKEAIKL